MAVETTMNATGRRSRRAQARGDLASARTLEKAPSGISGLDEITSGGLPRGRATLVCGGPGCGKTLFGLEFLVRGVERYGEPGVFLAFEETAAELAQNVASLGFDLDQLQATQKLAIDYVRVERSEFEESGEYDLEGLFVRLDLAIRSVGAKRVVLDTLETLFGGLPNQGLLRSEVRRLFRFLKDRGMTVVVTAEQGDGKLTRDGLEEYVSDCVIFLDHRVVEQTSTRRLRVVKYRGTTHGTNEYPFLIDEGGISILPVTSLGLAHAVSEERVSSGIPRLDEMLGEEGYYRGSTVLVTGTAGTGKTTIASSLARATCARGGRCLYFAYEESPAQLVRNMASVGIDLAPFTKDGRLRVMATRPTSYGLEMHLVAMHKALREFQPDVMIIDPITNLTTVGTTAETSTLLTRIVDYLKVNEITGLFTSLTSGDDDAESTSVGISSVVDTWLLLSVVKAGGERNRTLSIVKSRGMPHSNQASEFVMTSRGIELSDTYLGPHGVLTGSARLLQEEADKVEAEGRAAEEARKAQLLEARRTSVEAQITALREQLAAEESEHRRWIDAERSKRERGVAVRDVLSRSRHRFEPAGDKNQGGTTRSRRS